MGQTPRKSQVFVQKPHRFNSAALHGADQKPNPPLQNRQRPVALAFVLRAVPRIIPVNPARPRRPIQKELTHAARRYKQKVR
jgi:hypothetical protein